MSWRSLPFGPCNVGTGRPSWVIVGDGPLHAKLQQEHPDLSFEGLRRGEQLAAARMHVTSSQTGLRAPYADADAFVDAAVRLTEDSTLRNRIRRQARAHAAALDWQAVVDRFAALLTDAPNGPGHQPGDK